MGRLFTLLSLSLSLFIFSSQTGAKELSPHFLKLLDQLSHPAADPSPPPKHQLIQQLLVDHIFGSQTALEHYVKWIEEVELLMWEGQEPAYSLMIQLQARWEALHLSTYQSCYGAQEALSKGAQGASAGAVLTLASILIPQVDQRVPLYLKLFRHSFPLFGAHGAGEWGQKTQEAKAQAHPECQVEALWPAPAHLVSFAGSFWGSSHEQLEALAFDQLIYGAMAMSINFSTYELLRKIQSGLKGVSRVSRSALLAGVLVSAGAFAAERGTQQAIEYKSLRDLEQWLREALQAQEPEAVLERARNLAHFHALDFYRELHLWEERSPRRWTQICPEQSLRQKLGDQALQQALNSLTFAGCQWNYSAYQVLEEVKPLGLSHTQTRSLALRWPPTKRQLLEHLRYQWVRLGQDEALWIENQQEEMKEALRLDLASTTPEFCRDSAPALLFQVKSLVKGSLRPKAPSPIDRVAWDLVVLELSHLRRSLESLPKAVNQRAALSCSAN